MSEFEKLYTVQGEKIGEMPWNVYPRPTLKRDSFFCLNGTWQFGENEPTGNIIVPFAPETLLSGISKSFEKMVYRKEFSLPEGFVRDRVFLHFGAVDQHATVYLNGELLGSHTGGYSHFTFEITDKIKAQNVLTVEAVDTLDISLPYGKQCKRRGGMWYTPTSGIWQTVWIESTPHTYVKGIDVTFDGAKALIHLDGVDSGKVIFEDKTVEIVDSVAQYVPDELIYWSPEQPKLYYFTVEAQGDRVESYLAFRELDIREFKNKKRLCLNKKPYFFNGVLDQGYYSDGGLTPASHESYKEDILLMKAAGFNMLRKHIKVEPELFYYYCDSLGMAVFQDMVNNGRYSFVFDTVLPTVFMQKIPDKGRHKDKKLRQSFLRGMEETVCMLKKHPSICYWTVFNEGWGQFDADSAYEKIKSLDATRFVDTTSGWFRGKRSDVESLHVYFKRLKRVKSDKPIVISEFGGYALKCDGHIFNKSNEYGYRTFKSEKAFNDALVALFENELLPLVGEGVCASVYTQLSDVEDEINGLVTYDRRKRKFDERLKQINIKICEEICK